MQEGKILPPSKSLMFNQSVATDDGLLANSFARKTGMKFEEARQAVVHEVNDIKVCLRDNGMVECGGLGKLVTGEEGNIVFLPSKSPEIKSEHMGFLKQTCLFSLKRMKLRKSRRRSRLSRTIAHRLPKTRKKPTTSFA